MKVEQIGICEIDINGNIYKFPFNIHQFSILQNKIIVLWTGYDSNYHKSSWHNIIAINPQGEILWHTGEPLPEHVKQIAPDEPLIDGKWNSDIPADGGWNGGVTDEKITVSYEYWKCMILRYEVNPDDGSFTLISLA